LKKNYNVVTMKFDWDPVKAGSNLKKHKVPFELASTVFEDPLHLSIPDPDFKGEERWVTIGVAANTKLLVVVHTERLAEGEIEVIRIISARAATRKERKAYEEGI
jgi:uncharacterized DUF497 family protein